VAVGPLRYIPGVTEELGAPTMPCPRCAVPVPLGYVRCPRCHATMPDAARPRRETSPGAPGGTALPDGGGGFPWLLAGVCGVAAAVAVVWFVVRGGAGGAGADAPVAVPAQPRAAPTAIPDDQPPPAPTVDPRPRLRTEALSQLEQALAADRLWATVSEVGDAVVIRSAFCRDPGLGARLGAFHGKLVGLGFTAVSCLEQGGEPVFSRRLP
jgi:hypothetical protein